MGNRGGRIHDPATKRIVRTQASRRWLYCALAFKGRRRTVMGEGYTELFFADEAAALAAGHRPCFECLRPRAWAFAAAAGFRRTDALDRALDADRRAARREADPASLPDGAMVALGEEVFIVWRKRMRRWSPQGYGAPVDAPRVAIVLTPALAVAAMRAGFTPALALSFDA